MDGCIDQADGDHALLPVHDLEMRRAVCVRHLACVHHSQVKHPLMPAQHICKYMRRRHCSQQCSIMH